MLVALMSVEEHQHSIVPKVSLAESVLVQAMNLRVSKDIAYTL
jgi:hypothetical protein